MPIAPWAWCAWRVASLAAWSASNLAAAISNRAGPDSAARTAAASATEHDHRLLRAVDEVRLHGLEGADRLAELATRRGVLERDLFQALERARHRRGAGERAAPMRARRRRRRGQPARSRAASRRRRCTESRGSPARFTAGSMRASSRIDLHHHRPVARRRAAPRSRRRPAPRARGARCRGARRRAARGRRARVPRHDGHRAVGDLEPRAREQPAAEHAGLGQRERHRMSARRCAGSRWRRPACRRIRPPPRVPTPRPGRSRRPHPTWSAPSRRPRPARPPRTSPCRRTRESRSRTAADPAAAAHDRSPFAATERRISIVPPRMVNTGDGEDRVGEQALEQRRRVRVRARHRRSAGCSRAGPARSASPSPSPARPGPTVGRGRRSRAPPTTTGCAAPRTGPSPTRRARRTRRRAPLASCSRRYCSSTR